MKHYKKLKKAFGLNQSGFVDFPSKFSNTKISRIQNSDNRGGCTWCFPHGIDTSNSKISKLTKNWKSYRSFQWKVNLCKKN